MSETRRRAAASKPLSITDYGAAMTVVLVWAFNFVVSKYGVGAIPPLLFLTLRFGLVALLLLPWLRLPRRRFALVVLLSVLLGGLHFGCLFAGLAGTGAGPAAIVVQLGVPFSAALAFFFFRERLGAWQLAGMAIAFGGVYLLSGEPRAAPSLGHLLLIVVATLAWAGANIVIKGIGPISPFRLNAWVAALAVPQLFLASLIVEEGQLAALREADWSAFAAVAYTAVGASITAYGLWYYLIEKFEMNRIVPFTLLAPVLAVLLAAFLLHEPLTPLTIAGGLVTLAGVAMIQFLRAPLRVPTP